MRSSPSRRVTVSLAGNLDAAGATPLGNGSFWTLLLEVRWYLAFPPLLALYVRNKRLFAALGIALVLAYNVTTLHDVDIAVLPAFMLGIVAADWKVSGRGLRRYLFLALCLSLDLALVLEPHACLPPSDGSAEVPLFAAQSNVGWQLTAFCVVVAAGRWRALGAMLSLRPSVAIGTASYSFYLVQQPLITLAERGFVHGGGAPVALSAAFALSLGAGAAFYALVERPLISARARAVLEPPVRALAARLLLLCGSNGTLKVASPEAVPVPQPVVATPHAEI